MFYGFGRILAKEELGIEQVELVLTTLLHSMFEMIDYWERRRGCFRCTYNFRIITWFWLKVIIYNKREQPF